MCLAAIYWARLDKLYYAATRADAANAGFDDELIYKEVSNHWLARHSLGDGGKTRELIAEQGLTAEAQKAFDAWKQKENRTPY